MIFDDVFCKTFTQSFFIFLCGGADKRHIRNKIRIQLETNGLQVLYPEDLFMDMLNRDKKADLLEYENLLASNSDIVCIICESMGSAVELGAFIQNEKLEQKLIVCVNQKYARDKSFIMMGPVKHLQKNHKSSVFIYKEKEPKLLGEELSKKFKHLQRLSERGNKSLSFDNLSAYIAFIPIIAYFYKNIKRKELYKTLKELLISQKSLPENFNELFNASIKYLIKSGEFVTKLNDLKNDETLSLSPKGYKKTSRLLKLSWAKDKGVDKKLWYICLLFLLIVIIYYISTGGIHMDDIKSPSAVTIGELSRIVKEFEEKIQNGTEDPNRFLTLTEIEELWGRLIGDTNVLYSDMVQSLIQNIDERGLVRQKKENSRPEE